MSSKDDFNERRSVSRSGSMIGNSFKMGASLLQGFTGAGKNIKHLTLDSKNFNKIQQMSIRSIKKISKKEINVVFVM